jgi:hypothetical protein
MAGWLLLAVIFTLYLQGFNNNNNNNNDNNNKYNMIFEWSSG